MKYLQRHKRVIEYYQSSLWLYRLFCYTPETLGLHYGFWDHATKNRQEAILNENQAVIELGKINKNSKVLDIGCGVGGTAFYIAKKTGAQVIGININPSHVKLANEISKAKKLSKSVRFIEMDFMKMTFTDNSFDVVYCVESAGYSYPKNVFLKEIYRVLKPNGIAIFMDGYPTRNPMNKQEVKRLDAIQWAFQLAPLVTGDKFLSLMKNVGFKRATKIVKTEETRPSVETFGKLAAFCMPLAKVLNRIPNRYIQAIYQNTVALTNTADLYRLGLSEYCIHTGKK